MSASAVNTQLLFMLLNGRHTKKTQANYETPRTSIQMKAFMCMKM